MGGEVKPGAERCVEYRTFKMVDAALRAGDLAALRAAVDDPASVPNGPLPLTIGSCLGYAIYHSPLPFIRTLLKIGADPNSADHIGFPLSDFPADSRPVAARQSCKTIGKYMASDLSFVEYVCDQISGAGQVSFKKMFGEYAIYCDGKVVALVCDNQLFVKPTVAGRARLDEVVEAAPYPGAKPHWLIGEQLDDQRSISNLIELTASALPVPKPRKSKPKKPWV